VMVRLSDEEFDKIQKRANELGTAAGGYFRMLLRPSEIGEPFSTGEGQKREGRGEEYSYLNRNRHILLSSDSPATLLLWVWSL